MKIGSSAVLMQLRVRLPRRSLTSTATRAPAAVRNRPPVHLALDRLEAVDLALDPAGAPRRFDGGRYREEVFSQSVGEPDHGSVLAMPGALYPQSKFRSVTAGKGCTEGERDLAEFNDFGTLIRDPVKQALLL